MNVIRRVLSMLFRSQSIEVDHKHPRFDEMRDAYHEQANASLAQVGIARTVARSINNETDALRALIDEIHGDKGNDVAKAR